MLTKKLAPLERRKRWLLWSRRLDVFLAIANLITGGVDADTEYWLAVLSWSLVVCLMILIICQTRILNEIRREQQRPDYSEIARLEREVFGRG